MAFPLMFSRKWTVRLFLLVTICIQLVPHTQQCGVLFHNIIAHRAINYFAPDDNFLKDVIQAEQESFQNGAAFPDWGYNCLGFGSASEEAHWPPFLNATAQYIREKYGPSKSHWQTSAPAQKLISFMFGFSSHQVADVLWHDLDEVMRTNSQGFIEANAYVNFDGVYKVAHPFSDTGGDITSTIQLDTDFLLADWYVPAEDIVAVYKQINSSASAGLTVEILQECNQLLYTIAHAEKVGGALLFPAFASEGNFLVDGLESYPCGGMDDMAVWTGKCWGTAIDFLTGNFSSDVCLVYTKTLDDDRSRAERTKRNQNRQKAQANALQHAYQESKEILQRHGLEVVVVSDADRARQGDTSHTIGTGGFSYQLRDAPGRKRTEDREKEKQRPDKSQWANSTKNHRITVHHQQQQQPPLSTQPLVDEVDPFNSGTTMRFTSDTPLSYVGYSLATGDFNGDGIDDLVSGNAGYGTPNVPQMGSVSVFFGSSTAPAGVNSSPDLKNVTSSNVTLSTGHSDPSYLRFGERVTVVDFNADGVDDIAVSAPREKALVDLLYKGSIYIFFGSSDAATDTVRLPDVIIKSHYVFTNLGSGTLLGADVNGDGYSDLLIGSPYAPNPAFLPNSSLLQFGSVLIYLSSPSYQVTRNDTDKCSIDNHNDIDIHDDGVPADSLILQLSDANVTLYGEQAWSWFGTSILVHQSRYFGEAILVVGAPTHNHTTLSSSSTSTSTGAVVIYNMTEILNDNGGPHAQPDPMVTILGDQPNSQFGSSLSMGYPRGEDIVESEYLAVGSPSWKCDENAAGSGCAEYAEGAGRVDVYNMDRLALSAGGVYSFSSLESSLTVLGDSDYGRLGHGVRFVAPKRHSKKAKPGASASAEEKSTYDDFYITQPWYRGTGPHDGYDSGAVYFFKGGVPTFPSGTIDNPGLEATKTFYGGEERSRFGSAMAFLDWNDDRKTDVAVSAPRSGGADMFGTVYLSVD